MGFCDAALGRCLVGASDNFANLDCYLSRHPDHYTGHRPDVKVESLPDARGLRFPYILGHLTHGGDKAVHCVQTGEFNYLINLS
jgi:hypothetical protein